MIDDLDGGVDTLKGYKSLRTGPTPVVLHFSSEAEEATFIVKKVREWLADGVADSAICIGARTGALLSDRYSAMLAAAGIATVVVKKSRIRN